MNSQEFSFAWENADMQAGAWEHLRVVAFEGREALSELYRYELTLLARDPAPPVDPEELVGARATLRIETLSEPSTRYIHSVIVEAEEIGQTSAGPLYRVVLVPPFVRAAHRTRSRVFLEKTTRQIIDAVLLGDKQMEPAPKSGEPSTIRRASADEFTAAVELYKWRVLDPTRLDAISARPYCVQYNESDFAFVCRLLEEEGISFHVENDETTCLLVLADSDEGRARLDPFAPLGPGNLGRHINAMKLGKRLRPSKVSLVDFYWRKPGLEMGVSAATPMDGGDLFVSSYPGTYPDASSQGKPLAKSQLERFQTEARYASCESSARMLAAGSIFRLEQGAARTDGEYLVIALLVRGEASGELPPDARMMTTGVPYSAKLECARRGQGSTVMDSRFRPARVTPKPRILGSQTAMITADPWAKGAEIHVGGPEGGEIGCVRLRFPWDREVERLAREPSSCWVRVSQLFAGAGEGALWHPRVGNEVVVEFLDGDPDRPLVTGRVYNGTNRPPAAAAGSPTVSTFKSRSTPGGATFNELCFDDAAGQEHVKLHAGRDYSTAVGNDRVERIKNNSTSDVMVNRAETTGADRTVTVVGNNVETIGGDDVAAVAGDQRQSVGGSRDVSISGALNQTIAGAVTISAASNKTETIGGDLNVSVGASITQTAGANILLLAAADVGIQGAVVQVTASGEILLGAGGSAIKISGAGIQISGAAITVSGGSVDVKGGVVKVN